MNSILVKDYMVTAVPAIHPETTISEAIKLLDEFRLIGCAVVNEKKEMVGFISEQDCIRKLLDSSYYCQSIPRVCDVMRSDVLVRHPEDSIVDLASLMMEGKPKVYPVVTNRQLVGVISRRDVLRALDDKREECSSLGAANTG